MEFDETTVMEDSEGVVNDRRKVVMPRAPRARSGSVVIITPPSTRKVSTAKFKRPKIPRLKIPKRMKNRGDTELVAVNTKFKNRRQYVDLPASEENLNRAVAHFLKSYGRQGYRGAITDLNRKSVKTSRNAGYFASATSVRGRDFTGVDDPDGFIINSLPHKKPKTKKQREANITAYQSIYDAFIR